MSHSGLQKTRSRDALYALCCVCPYTAFWRGGLKEGGMSSETAGSDFWVVEVGGISMGAQLGTIEREMGVYFGYFCLAIRLLPVKT